MKNKKTDIKATAKHNVMDELVKVFPQAVSGADYGFKGGTLVIRMNIDGQDVDVKLAISAPAAKVGNTYDSVKEAYLEALAAEEAEAEAEAAE